MDREKVIGHLGILRTWCADNPIYGMTLSVEDCDKAVGWLDDAIALLKAQDKDAEIIRRCRDGKVLKHVGDGVVVLNFEWWRKMVEKCDHIKIVPSVEELLKAQEPVVHGQWQERHVDYASDCAIDEVQTLRCSVCRLYLTTPYLYSFTDFKFCPNCGAKMDGEREDGA